MRISTYLFALIVLFISCRLTYAQGEIQNPTFPFWKTLGNSATNPTNNFLGTIDAQDLVIRTTNLERMRVLSGGNIGIGTAAPSNSALLDIASTTRGVLVPRVALTATTVAAPVAAPATSLLIYNTNTASDVTPGYYFWDGTKWARIIDANNNSNDWKLLGNAGTNAATNFIGTTDAVDWVVRTSNTERMRVRSGGNVGIGIAAPSNLLTINNGGVTPATIGTYPFAVARSGIAELTAGSDASLAYLQSWNSKPLLINGQGNFVAINLTTAPIQNLDINGRMNVNLGVIQRGTTQINVTNDLGLYSQPSGNWIRIAANAAPVKFFTDQGGANGAGTNATMSVDNQNGGGVMIAAEIGGTGNAGTPYQRAALDITSTSKGFLMPRMTTAQRDAMGNSLAEGLMIYNIDNDCPEWWDTKAAINGGNGYWNSVCDFCENVVFVNSNQTGFNLNTYVTSLFGIAQPETYCVYVGAGVTLTPSGNGGGNGAAGNSGFNASTMPIGARIKLFNYGTILGGGGNGGRGGQESDAACTGDNVGQAGGGGGHGILTNSGVQVTAYNYGTIRAGGGGGGGGGFGCCSSSGGGGGGAGTPAGTGGAGGATPQCVRGFVCTCSTGGGGNAGTAGTALTGGTGGAGSNSLGSTGCPTCNARNASNGGNGGGNGLAGTAGGNNEGNGTQGAGGAAGLALQGNGSGSSLTNVSGTVTGGVNP